MTLVVSNIVTATTTARPIAFVKHSTYTHGRRNLAYFSAEDASFVTVGRLELWIMSLDNCQLYRAWRILYYVSTLHRVQYLKYKLRNRQGCRNRDFRRVD